MAAAFVTALQSIEFNAQTSQKIVNKGSESIYMRKDPMMALTCLSNTSGGETIHTKEQALVHPTSPCPFIMTGN